MAIKLVGRKVALQANFLNISIFKESWFLKEDILNSNDIDSTKSYFTPQFIQINNNSFQLLIQPHQILLAIKETGSFECIKIVSKIVNSLPHTPYENLGINIDYFLEDDNNELVSTLFNNNGNSMYEFFQDENAEPAFGAYLSKNYLDCRLKLDIKPAFFVKSETNEKSKGLLFEFNFHKDLGEQGIGESVSSMIANADSYRSYSEELVNKLQIK